MDASALEEQHLRCLHEAVYMFKTAKKMGGTEFSLQFLERLSNDIQVWFLQVFISFFALSCRFPLWILVVLRDLNSLFPVTSSFSFLSVLLLLLFFLFNIAQNFSLFSAVCFRNSMKISRKLIIARTFFERCLLLLGFLYQLYAGMYVRNSSS